MFQNELRNRILRNTGTANDSGGGGGGGGSATGNEAAGSAATPSTPPAGVTLTKEEYAEMIAAKAKVSDYETKLKALEQSEVDTRTLLNSKAAKPDQEAALRRTLTRNGYSPEEVEALVAEQFAETPEPPDRRGTRPRQGEAGEEDRVKSLEARLDGMQKDLHKSEAMRLNEVLDTTVTKVIDTVEEVATLISDLTPSEEGDEKALAKVHRAKASLASEIRRETLDLLRERRAREMRAAGGREVWSDTWIGEAAAAAAKAVGQRHQDLRPETSKVGRSPEAELWANIDTKKPVQSPKYERGMDMSKAQDAVRKFAVDTLLQSVASNPDGAGRV